MEFVKSSSKLQAKHISLIMHANKHNRIRDTAHNDRINWIKIYNFCPLLSPLSCYASYVCGYIVIFYYFVLYKCTVSTYPQNNIQRLVFLFSNKTIKPSLFVYDHEAKHVMISMQHYQYNWHKPCH
eukprot:971472_1